jgi:hypothetical protein
LLAKSRVTKDILSEARAIEMYITTRCLALTFFLTLLQYKGCERPVTFNVPPDSRPPNTHELFYTAIAANFGDSEICKKISKRALDERGPDLGNTEWRMIFERSQCYFHAALRTKNDELCDSVEDVITAPPNGATISRSECREVIQKNQHYAYEPSPDYYTVGDFMTEMGYKDEDFYAAEFARNSTNNSIYRFYETIRDTGEFKAKVWVLESYDEPYSKDRLRPANEDEILTQMFAVENSLPDFCAKVSPNSYVEGAAGLPWSFPVPPKVALRNACFYAVSQNRHQSALCSKILKFEANAIGASSATQEGCEMQLKIQESDKSWRGYYPPVYFQELEPFLQILQRLGYAKPFLSNRDGVKWSDFYSFMVFEAPLEQKREFLKRLEALPSFSD